MANATNLVWNTIAVETLSKDAQAAYAEYKALYATMKKAREAFEAMVIKESGIPATSTLRFGYRFGKLSVAVDVADKPKAATSGKGALSLSDYMKLQANR